MRWRPSARLRVYALLVLVGVALALLGRRPEPVLLAAPLAFVIALDLVGRQPPVVRLELALSTSQATEGETVDLRVGITTESRRGMLDLLVVVPPGVSLGPGFPPVPWRLALTRGTRTFDIPLRVDRWGRHEIGPTYVRLRSPLGLFVAEGEHAPSTVLAAYPRPEGLRRLVPALRTQAAVGTQLSTAKGSGIEFADARPFMSGDRPREINWRLTARHGNLWVNQRHPDRSTDVVLFLDSFGPSTLAPAVRAVYSLADAYLARRDRVGLIRFGAAMQWLRPAMGSRQLYVIVDALISTRARVSEAWRDIGTIPPHFLPAQALVVAVSPLEDERIEAALHDLRDRGIDLVVVDVSPEPYLPPARDDADLLARRLWAMQREQKRDRYRARGIPVAEWSEEQPLASAVEQLTVWPRRRAG